jgi:hypothetical protein
MLFAAHFGISRRIRFHPIEWSPGIVQVERTRVARWGAEEGSALHNQSSAGRVQCAWAQGFPKNSHAWPISLA